MKQTSAQQPPPSQQTYACSSLSAMPDTSNPLLYHFTASAQVTNGAVLNSADFSYGGGATQKGVLPSSQNMITASHPYAKTGTYNAGAVLNFTANGASATANCTTQVNVSTSQTYSGVLSALPDSSNTMVYHFTGQTSTQGGAIFDSASIMFGDGQSANGLKPASGQTSVQTSHTYASQGTYTATATFTFTVSGATKTTTATTQVIVTGSGGGGGGGNQQVVAKDSFSRPNQSGWGTSSDGQHWGTDAGSSTAFSLKNHVALISNTGNSYAGILGSVLTNSQILFTGRMSNFSNSNFGGVLRYKDTNNWYKAYIDGTNLVIQKRLNSNYTILKQLAFKAAANTNYTIRFQAVGNTLSVRVWPASSNEPSGWTTTAQDSSFSSGYDGLRALPQNGNVVGYYAYAAYQL